MTWSVLQSASGTNSSLTTSSISVTYPNNVAAGTKIIAALSLSGTRTVSAVQDGSSNNLTQLGVAVNGTSQHTFLYAMDTPVGDVGTKPTITVTFSATNAPSSLLLQEVSGLLAGNTSAMLDGTPGTGSGTSGSGNAGPPTFVSAAAGAYLVYLYGDDGGPLTYTGPAGYTADANGVNSSPDADMVISYKNSTGGTETGSYAITGTSCQWSVLMAAFQLAAGGTAAPPAQQQYGSRNWRRRHRHHQRMPTQVLAVTPDAVGAGQATSGATSLSWSHTCGPNAAVLAWVVVGAFPDTANAFSSVTLDGTAMTPLGSPVHDTAGSPAGFGQWFGLTNVAAGTHTIAAAISGGVPAGTGAMEGNSVSYLNAAGFGTPQAFGTSSGSTPATLTHTGSAPTSIVAFGLGAGHPISSPSPGTNRWIANLNNNTGADNAAIADIPGGGSRTVTWALGASDAWLIQAVEVLLTASGPATESGSFAITLPLLITTVSGQVVESGAFSITLPVLTTTLSGHVVESGTFAITLPVLQTTLTGQVTEHGAFSITLPTLVSSLAGTAQQTESGTFAITLPVLKTTLTGSVTEFGTFAITLPAPRTTLTGTAQHTESGAFTITLPVLKTTLNGHVVESGGFGIVLPTLHTSLTGTAQHTESGTLAITLPALRTTLTGTDSGANTETGSFIIVIPPGMRQQPFGAILVRLPTLITSLQAKVDNWNGPFALTLPKVTTAIAARIATKRGAFNIQLPTAVASLVGHTQLTITGTPSLVLPSPVFSLNAARVSDGPLNLVFNPTMMMRDPVWLHRSVLAVEISAPELVLAGSVQHEPERTSGWARAKRSRREHRRQLKAGREQAATRDALGEEGDDQ
jgi:hypothetical protein